MTPLRLQLFNKPYSEKELSHPDVYVFDFRMQKVPLIVSIIQTIVITTALVIYYGISHFSQISTYIIFAIGIAIDLYYILSALYAQHVKASGVAAVSPEYFYTGTRDSMWRISWKLLKKSDFSTSDHFNQFSGKLFIYVAGQKIPVYLSARAYEMEQLDWFLASIQACIDNSRLTDNA